MDYLIGATILSIEGLHYGSEEVQIVTDKGTLRLYHSQDCCECVQVEEVTPDESAIVGQVVTNAEERTEEQPCEYGDELWTFYEIDTADSSLTIRWSGSSNGYYSVSVYVEWTPVDDGPSE